MKKAVLLFLCLALLLTVTSCGSSGKFVTVQFKNNSSETGFSYITINCDEIQYIQEIPQNGGENEYRVLMISGAVSLTKEEARKVYRAIGVAMP